ncbi:MAG: Periplasmic oligopeptide-binding protein [Hyphomonas sp. TMED17]|nr:MAG: Periplasmic oligopeptide-binding protein [Hyphomonas sp. TMED17]
MAFRSATILISTLMSLVVVACGGGQVSEDIPTLRRGISAKVDTLDPHRSAAAWENIIIGDMIVGMMQTSADGEVIPGVAESWEVDESGLVWTFKMKETVWSDSVPLTAHDFVYAFRRMQDPALAAQYSSLLYVIKNAEAVNNYSPETGDGLPPEELGIRAIDDYTLEITLAEPAPYLLELLTHYTTYPVPSHIVEVHGEDWVDPENIVVNGPYKLVYWVTGDQIVVDKNPLFYEADQVCFERVSYFEIEDSSAVERRIEAGQLDINNAFDGTRETEIRESFPGWPRKSPVLATTYWSMNSSAPPFDDVRVRKAIAMSLDREYMANNVLSAGILPAYGFVPQAIGNYETEKPVVSWATLDRSERLEMAKNLLIEAGYGPDNPLSFEYIYRSGEGSQRVAPVAQSNWNDIAPWVDANLLMQDTKVLYNRLRQSDFEIADGGWVADFSDPINFLYLLDSTTGQQNYGNYDNPAYDALLLEASMELDLVKRAEIFAEAEAMMLEDAPITPMFYSMNYNLVDPTLTGWGENAKNIHRSRWLCRDDIQPQS